MSETNSTLKKFGYPDTLLREYAHWVVLLKPDQTTVGTMIIANKSDATYLGELNSEEWAEFAKVSADIELALINTFGAEKFNYLALMMKDPNVHFHLVPRYSKPIVFEGEEYHDVDWPQKTQLNKIVIDENSFKQLQGKLVEAIV